jgi:hypothetical protein
MATNIHQQIKEMMEEAHNIHFQKVLERKLKNSPSVSFLGDNEDLEYFINIQYATQQNNPQTKTLTILA